MPGRPLHLHLLPDLPPSGPGPHSRGVGAWRVRRDGKLFEGLPAAIATVRRGWPDRLDLQALAWQVMPRLPGQPLASDNLKTRNPTSARMPLEAVALTHPWIGLNTTDAVNVLWVDCDHQRWPALLGRARALGLPEPAWTCRSERGAHLVWILRTPVVVRLEDLTADGRRARFLSVTHALLRRALEGDEAASLRGLTKNPWSSRWTTTIADRVQAVDLADILRPLEALAKAEGWQPPDRRSRPARDLTDAPKGTRLWVALCDRVYRTGETDEVTIRGWADELADSMGSPAPASQRRGMARRAARFMQTRWRGRRGSAPLAPEAIRARQVQAGRTTAAARAADRDDRLRAVVEELRASGLPVTQAAVAEAAGVSERTARRAWPSITDRTLAPPPSGSSCSSSTSTPSSGTPVPIEEDIDGPILAALFADLMTDDESDPPLPARPACPRPLLPLPPPRPSLLGLAALARASRRRARRRARDRAKDRQRWHEEAAQAGLHAYRVAVGRRMADLHGQRVAALAAIPLPHDGVWLMRMTSDPEGDTLESVEVIERRKRIGGAWASKLKAERRLSQAMEARLLAAAILPGVAVLLAA